MKKRSQQINKNYTREALSIIFIGLGIILILAIISYDRTDNPDLDIKHNSIQIKNWLGPLGAALADPMMNFTLGYPILALPILIIFCAVQAYRKVAMQVCIRPVIVTLIWAIIISIVLAMPEAFETGGQIKEYFPSGLVGGMIAENLVLYLGKFGSVLILLVSLMAMAVLSLRLDINTITGFISDLVNRMSESMEQGYNKWQQARLQRRKDRIKAREFKQSTTGTETNTVRPLRHEPEIASQRQTVIEEAPKPQPPPSIRTTLDEILQHADDTKIDTKVIKKAGDTHAEPPIQEVTEEMYFEVQEEAKVEELDYDKLVKESVARYQFPSVDLLETGPSEDTQISHEELKANAAQLEAKLMDFGLEVKVIRVTAGPVITLYELQPAPGVKVSQMYSPGQ